MIENRARAFVAALIGVVLVVGSPVAALAATADSKVAPTASKDKKNDHAGKKDEQADKRHDNGDKRRDRKDHKNDKDRDGNRGDRKAREHRDDRNRNWDHSRDAGHRSHEWDTHRRYYRYGYYGPGYYDDCGYYGSGYRGDGRDSRYYGPDACSYEYGGYGSAYLVRLNGEEVVPTGGAPDAVGTANVEVDPSAGRICYRLAYDGVSATGTQIREGRPGENGPVVVMLDLGENGDDGCVPADPQALAEIQNDPLGYYLSVDADGYPEGSMRGQLESADYRR